MAWGSSPIFALAEALNESGNYTSDNFNSIGADTIFVFIQKSQHVAPTVTDNQSNTYTQVRQENDSFGDPTYWLFVALNVTTNATHNISFTTADGYRGFAGMGFSGGHLTAATDQNNGNHGVFTSTLTAGSITPTAANTLLVTGGYANPTISIDTGYTIAAGSATDIAIAYKVQGAAAAINPTWSSSASPTHFGAIHSNFFPASGGGGGGSTGWGRLLSDERNRLIRARNKKFEAMQRFYASLKAA